MAGSWGFPLGRSGLASLLSGFAPLFFYIVGPLTSYTDLFPTPVAAPCPFPPIFCCAISSFVFCAECTAVAVAASPVVSLCLPLSLPLSLFLSHTILFLLWLFGCALFACCLFAAHSLSVFLFFFVSLSLPLQSGKVKHWTPPQKTRCQLKNPLGEKAFQISHFKNSCRIIFRKMSYRFQLQNLLGINISSKHPPGDVIFFGQISAKTHLKLFLYMTSGSL